MRTLRRGVALQVMKFESLSILCAIICLVNHLLCILHVWQMQQTLNINTSCVREGAQGLVIVKIDVFTQNSPWLSKKKKKRLIFQQIIWKK